MYFQVMSYEEKIKDHTRKLEAGEHLIYCQVCCQCGVEPEGGFRIHERRRRTFRVVVERCVRVYRSWVLRLKCPHCKRTFTDYPPFRVALQTVRQPDRAGENEGFFGDRKVLPGNGSSPADVPGV